MFRSVEPPRIVVLGLSLELYERAMPGYMQRLEEQLHKFVAPLQLHLTMTGCRLCWLAAHVAEGVAEAEAKNADAILLVPLSYTASGMTVPSVMKTSLPLIIWNTQEAERIEAAYTFDDLLMNHVTQGTQDVTNVLLRSDRRFGMESGHCKDASAIDRLVDWLRAARAARFARTLRTGILGRPFEGMTDFDYDEKAVTQGWGPTIVALAMDRLASLSAAAPEADVQAIVAKDRQAFEVAPDVDATMHARSARMEWALRRLIGEVSLDAFTFNFLELIESGRFETLPFLGINKMIGEGLGYAGEGDVVTAAHMAQMRQLCGAANFTEIFTVDYRADRMLMMHMQECNPALARRDRKVRLVRKDFWAPGVQPYVGMHFTLEPGPVTLTCLTSDAEGGLCYIACETRIVDAPPLEHLDVPHWLVQLDEPVGEFLTAYSMAGGPHHLVSVPGHQASALEKLAHLQGFGFEQL